MPSYKNSGGVIVSSLLTCDKCPVYGHCAMDLKRNGGFKAPEVGGVIEKGHRAKYVGYRLITDGAEGRGAKEDYIACHAYVEVIQDRARFGKALIEEKKDGERISIIAQEGGTIKRRFEVGFNSRGQIVKPQAEAVAGLEAAGYKVNREDRSEATSWENVTIDVTVPNFDKVPTANQYAQEILRRELDAQATEEDFTDKAWEEVQAKQSKEDAKPKPSKAEKEVDFTLGGKA